MENLAMISKELFQAGLLLHGHKCPAMPMGLRVGQAALEKLGVERATDGQLMALVELGDAHCATCFADGIQMATGCTFGKGNIQKLNYGKFGLTLIDKKSGRSVRVTPKAQVMLANKQTPFFTEYRMKGIPASQVPAAVIDPMVDKVLTMAEAQMMDVGEVQAHEWHEHKHSFDSFVCERCGEMTVEPYGRIHGEQKVCIPCQQALLG
jgi:formylmethanofuran dehydrogenase subunit E